VQIYSAPTLVAYAMLCNMEAELVSQLSRLAGVKSAHERSRVPVGTRGALLLTAEQNSSTRTVDNTTESSISPIKVVR
jgi:hypothetical protein